MSSKIIIIADMQRFKVFSVKKDPLNRESVDLLENIESLSTHQRIGEKVSDRQGNFQGVGASGKGEDHNLALEEVHRRIKEIAQQVSNTLTKYKHDAWYFAAPKATNNQIVALLTPIEAESMTMNLQADLTKIPDDKILSHFAQ
jgi:hypothetical protein